MTAPNWVRRPEAAARTLVRRTATLGAAVARTVGAQEIAAIASFECKNDATRDVVAVEVLQLGQLEGGVKTRFKPQVESDCLPVLAKCENRDNTTPTGRWWQNPP